MREIPCKSLAEGKSPFLLGILDDLPRSNGSSDKMISPDGIFLLPALEGGSTEWFRVEVSDKKRMTKDDKDVTQALAI